MSDDSEGGVRLFVSPHLDDAVLSCGALIARSPGAQVVTVFAGRPRQTVNPADAVGATEWDRLSGFSPGDDVVGLRRAEDELACAVLGAHPVWLDFVDDQYHEPAPSDAIVDALADVVRNASPDELFIPLGLFHRDHERTHRACLRLAGNVDFAVIAYEDSPYRVLDDLVDARIAELIAEPVKGGDGPRRVELGAGESDPRKQRAVDCYRSQTRALEAAWPGYAAALTEERYWRLSA